MQDVSAAYGHGWRLRRRRRRGWGQTQPIGSITPFFLSISLIIRHTAEVHDQVADLLRQLRRLQDLQVSIEVRFITVSDDFFEQIGVDFDFSIHSNAVGQNTFVRDPEPRSPTFGVAGHRRHGHHGRRRRRTGPTRRPTTGGGQPAVGQPAAERPAAVAAGRRRRRHRRRRRWPAAAAAADRRRRRYGGGGGFGGGDRRCGGSSGASQSPPTSINPIPRPLPRQPAPLVVGTQGGGIGNFRQNLRSPSLRRSPSLIAPFNAVPSAGATFGIAFLSDLEVYLFLTAAQGDTRANILQAPKVTTFNGAVASIISNTELQYYVVAAHPDRRPGLGGLPAHPRPVARRCDPAVTPVVSADRRYVRMTLSPLLQRALNGFTTFPVPAALSAAVVSAAVRRRSTARSSSRSTTTTTVTTTVTVPDGGTVLAGRREASQRRTPRVRRAGPVQDAAGSTVCSETSASAGTRRA